MGTRVAGGWQWTGLTLPPNATVRVRGNVMGGKNNGSSWLVEKTLSNAVLPPTIFVSDGAFGIHSNRFGFNVGGQDGQTVILESSTNLLNWIPIITNKLGTGPSYFNDPEWFNSPLRFYRAVTP